MPPLIRSFIRSYRPATLSKTPRTSGAFSSAATRRAPNSASALVSSSRIGQEDSPIGLPKPLHMPELPEVETVRRGLALKMTGRSIARAELRRPDLRRPFPPMLAERLDGARIGELARRGKYILIELDETGLLLLHLGMRSEEHTSEL